MTGSAGVSVSKFKLLQPEDPINPDLHQYETFYRPGLQFDVKVMFAPLRSFGLGLNAYYNLNKLHDFLGLTATVALGQVRHKKD